MARTALLTCARCGAPLEIPPGATRATCKFCKARLSVDDSRTQVMPPGRAFPAIGQRAGIYAATGIVLFAGATSLVALLASAPPAPHVPELPSPTEVAPEPQALAVVDGGVTAAHVAAVGRGWLFVDVDGDGADDAVGIYEDGEGTERSRFLGAASGATGRELWRVDSSVVGADPSAALRALVGNDLLVSDANGSLRDLDPRTGKVLWTRSLPSAARGFCAGAREVVVQSEDGASHRVSLATGADLADAARAPCEHAYTSRTEGPNFTVARGAEGAKLAGPAANALVVQRVLVPLVGAARVVVGAERSGAPALAVVAGGSLLWRALVIPDGAVDASAVAPLEATVRYDRVVVPYGVAGSDGPTLHVACFDLASGRRVWDETPPTSSFASFADAVDVAISRDRRVFLRVGPGRLAVLDLATGRQRSTIGGP